MLSVCEISKLSIEYFRSLNTKPDRRADGQAETYIPSFQEGIISYAIMLLKYSDFMKMSINIGNQH